VQDARLRIVSTFLLSCAAFSSVAGATMVFLWWTIFARDRRNLPGRRTAAIIFGTLALVAVFTTFVGGDGTGYFLRLSVVMLIAFWAFGGGAGEELFDVAVWAFGNRLGFDIGLTADMALGSLGRIEDDIILTRHAIALKGTTGPVRSLVPLGVSVVMVQIRRAGCQAKTLAVRGYHSGGTYVPCFKRGKEDYVAFFCSILITLALLGSFVSYL
jgi:hypothetical protein